MPTTFVQTSLPYLRVVLTDEIIDPEWLLKTPNADPAYVESYLYPVMLVFDYARGEMAVLFPNEYVAWTMIVYDSIGELAEGLGEGWEAYGKTRITKQGATIRDLGPAVICLNHCLEVP